MRKMMTGFAFAAALALCGGSAFAVDQNITGKKLLIINPPSGTQNNKIVYLSKDPSIALPGGAIEDPRCVPDGTNNAQLTVTTAAGESASIPLPCGGWTVNGTGTLYKYKDTSGATCKIVLIKGGKLQKAVCKGSQVTIDLATTPQDQGAVDVVVRTGAAPRRWCAEFNGTACTVVKNGSDGKKYLAKNCTVATPPCGASPSGAFIEVANLF